MRNFWIVTLFFSFSFTSFITAQEKKNPYAELPLKERIFFGGGFGLNFGTITYIRLAPVIGINISPKFSAGGGPSYQYYKDSRYNPAFQTSIYGGSVFARHFVLQSIFLQTEVEMLNLEAYRLNPAFGELNKSRVNVPIWFVGAGYSQRSSRGSGLFITVLYDLIQDVNSPYPNNVTFRVGGFLSL